MFTSIASFSRKLLGTVTRLHRYATRFPQIRPAKFPVTTYFVTRHRGARVWAAEEGIIVDEAIEHLDPRKLQAGDIVIGSLPVNLAAEVCARGGRYLHLTLEVPPAWRGIELTTEDMRRFGARVEEYGVKRMEK